MDRSLSLAFGISLACHLVFLGAQWIRFRMPVTPRTKTSLDVIYEYALAEEELRQLERQLSDLRGRTPAPPGIPAPQPQIRIPNRPAVTLSAMVPDTNTGRAAVVDLTNLVEAAQGDPVLLSYFSALREQIQQTANRHTWLTGQTSEGVVYVSFVLNASGHAHSVTVLSERSSTAKSLQQIATKIVRASSPFAPFPPSLAESSKTVVVPLEFLLGS